MGINAEYINLLIDLKKSGDLRGSRVIELGAQDVCPVPEVVTTLLSRAGLGNEEARFAKDLYRRFGFDEYKSIDQSGYLDSLPYDLNKDLLAQGYGETFDLVTNAGTLEHCFDQACAFRNMHNLCKVGGLFLHVLPSLGAVNHAFYNYHPRMVWELAYANDYEIICVKYSIDFRPVLFDYTVENLKQHEDRDVMLYVVMRKKTGDDFRIPTDRIFTDGALVQESEFRPWIKTNWEGTKGYEAI